MFSIITGKSHKQVVCIRIDHRKAYMWVEFDLSIISRTMAYMGKVIFIRDCFGAMSNIDTTVGPKYIKEFAPPKYFSRPYMSISDIIGGRTCFQ